MTATLPGATSLEDLLGTVGEAMTPQVVSVQVDIPADIALRRLERAKVSGASVVDGGRVAGVVTVGDLLAPTLASGPAQTTGPFHRHEHHLTTCRVRDLMTTEPIMAGTDWSLARAVSAMDQVGINRVPVVDPAGRPVGILTRDDVLRILARRIRELPLPARSRSRIEPD
jgi:CBS domain-containing protein